jgi:hypothetical protein
MVNRWNPVLRCKSHNLTDVAAKVWIGANKHRAECTFCNGIESFLEFTFVFCPKWLEL